MKSSQAGGDTDYETIQLNTSTYNLLWDKLQVVMLVKFVESENEAYWILLSDVPTPNQAQESFTIRIPKQNRLSTIGWKEIQDYIVRVYEGKIEIRQQNTFRIN